MKDRKTLREGSIALIVLAVLDLINWVTSGLAEFINGDIDDAIAEVAPDLMSAVKACFVVILALQAALILAQIIIGWFGLKVSRNPIANQGYITAAKVFYVLNIIAAVSAVISLIGSGSDALISNILTLICALADVLIYYYFIKSAKAVRQSVLENK